LVIPQQQHKRQFSCPASLPWGVHPLEDERPVSSRPRHAAVARGVATLCDVKGRWDRGAWRRHACMFDVHSRSPFSPHFNAPLVAPGCPRALGERWRLELGIVLRLLCNISCCVTSAVFGDPSTWALLGNGGNWTIRNNPKHKSPNKPSQMIPNSNRHDRSIVNISKTQPVHKKQADTSHECSYCSVIGTREKETFICNNSASPQRCCDKSIE
jgi:hypothetical protein